MPQTLDKDLDYINFTLGVLEHATEMLADATFNEGRKLGIHTDKLNEAIIGTLEEAIKVYKGTH